MYCNSTEDMLKISFNRCFDSYTGYGIYMYDTGGELDNNEAFGNAIGGIVIAGEAANSDKQLLNDGHNEAQRSG